MDAGIFRILFWVLSSVPVFSGSRQNRTVVFVAVLLNGSTRRFFTLVFLDTPLKWSSAFLFSVSFAQFIGAYVDPAMSTRIDDEEHLSRTSDQVAIYNGEGDNVAPRWFVLPKGG